MKTKTNLKAGGLLGVAIGVFIGVNLGGGCCEKKC